MDTKTLYDTLEAQKDAITEKDSQIASLEDKIANRKRFEEIRQEQGKKKAARKGAYFTKAYHSTIQELIAKKVLSTSEQAFLLSVIAFMDYTNHVVGKDGQRLILKDIASLIGLGERQVSRITESLEEKGVLTKVGQGVGTVIRLNERYFFRGDEADKNVANT